jgi:4-hydroxythreonine-4-phosphate dehydrogenase
LSTIAEAPLAPLAVTLGDPAGIGPETVARAWALRVEQGLPPFFAIGARAAFEAIGFRQFAPIGDPAPAAELFDRALPLIELPAAEPVAPGRPDPAGAHQAIDALELGVGLARNGVAGALVTGPVSKAQLQAIGFGHPGQTEFVAERCGVSEANVAMLLVGGGLRASPVTIHEPLAEVPARLTSELIMARGRAVARALSRDFGIAAPRLAVAGLNPHAGEGGALGREDLDIIAPAIAALCAEGVDAMGPLSADTLFHARARSGYDAALCMYHDQALIPVKTLAFDEGVNLTVGLPIVRAAPDHGTAYAIAGRAMAEPGAMIAAIRLAAECARRRRDAS